MGGIIFGVEGSLEFVVGWLVKGLGFDGYISDVGGRIRVFFVFVLVLGVYKFVVVE